MVQENGVTWRDVTHRGDSFVSTPLIGHFTSSRKSSQ